MIFDLRVVCIDMTASHGHRVTTCMHLGLQDGGLGLASGSDCGRNTGSVGGEGA